MKTFALIYGIVSILTVIIIFILARGDENE